MLFVFACGLAHPAAAQEEPPARAQIGRIIHVLLPITGDTTKLVKRMVDRAIDQAKKGDARLVLVFEFDVPKGQKSLGRGSDFGATLALASFLSGEELSGVRTVAYLPQPIEGHAVLAAIACQEIIMAPEASIGAAGIDERNISPMLRSTYTEIAGRRRTVPTLLALGMLDPAIEVQRVLTDSGPEYVTPDGLEELKKHHVVERPTVVKRAGEQGVFSGEEARRWDIARYLAADRGGLSKALEIPIEDDPSLEGDWKPIRVGLEGPICFDSVEQAKRMVQDQVNKNKVNFICLWIDSPGGSLKDAVELANYLSRLDPSQVRTVAYVPDQARADAAVVALACDQVAVHEGTILGGPGAGQPSKDEIDDARRVIKELAQQKGRSWSLLAAMIDPNLNVFRATRLGEVEYFSDEELQDQPSPEKWSKDALVSTPGTPLTLSGTQALRYNLADKVVHNFAEFKKDYGIGDLALAEPGWADTLIRALASPGVAVLLLLCGFAALYIEIHTPGIGVGGFTAAICFLLFFWSRYLGHTAGWLEAILFVSGVSCLLLELFVIPGFGIFGLGGGALILASLVLASQTFVWPQNEYQFGQLQQSLLTVAAAVIGLIVVAVLIRRRLPRSRLFGHIMLEPPAGEEAETIKRREALVDFHDLVGKRGSTTTQLTPSGKARFGDKLVDVIADGDLIRRGATIEVVEVRGNRVLVKEVGSG